MKETNDSDARDEQEQELKLSSARVALLTNTVVIFLKSVYCRNVILMQHVQLVSHLYAALLG